MTYSLIGADRTTHIKIVSLALAGSLLLGLAVHASHAADPSNKTQNASGDLVAKTTSRLTTAHPDRATVCRFTSL